MSMGYWCLSGESLLEMLKEVAAGDDPDMVYAEHYANSKKLKEKTEEEDL